jgi:hypothetical protein
MTPKNSKGDATAASATPFDLSPGQYDAIMAKLAILDTLIAKMSSLEKLLQEANSKIAAQQAEIHTKDKAIADLKTKVNNRKWSVRINNLTTSPSRTVPRRCVKNAVLRTRDQGQYKQIWPKFVGFSVLLVSLYADAKHNSHVSIF